MSIFVTWCAGEHFCSLQILAPSHTILSPGVYICSQGQLSPGGGGGGSPGDGGGGSPGDNGGGSPGEREGDGSRMPPPKAHSWTPIFTQSSSPPSCHSSISLLSLPPPQLKEAAAVELLSSS